MNSDLPATGTAALLELLDPFVPDVRMMHQFRCPLPAGRTADVAGLRWPGWGTLVWRQRGTGAMPLLLGSRTLPAAIRPSARGTRDLTGPAAAGQSTGATSVAAGASVDRTGTVLREEPTRVEQRVLQELAVHLGDGTAGGCGERRGNQILNHLMVVDVRLMDTDSYSVIRPARIGFDQRQGPISSD